jgi:hypothetical protein
VERPLILIGRAAGRGAFKAVALVGAFAIIVATWWWDASLLTAAADANLQLIEIVTGKLPFDWGSKLESALRIFGADRALLLIEGVAIAKVVMLGFAYLSAAGGKSKTPCATSQRLGNRSGFIISDRTLRINPQPKSLSAIRVGPRVRIRLARAESQQTFGPFRVVAIHKRSENQSHRTRVPEVRIQFPPAASLQTFGPSVEDAACRAQSGARCWCY